MVKPGQGGRGGGREGEGKKQLTPGHIQAPGITCIGASVSNYDKNGQDGIYGRASCKNNEGYLFIFSSKNSPDRNQGRAEDSKATFATGLPGLSSYQDPLWMSKTTT